MFVDVGWLVFKFEWGTGMTNISMVAAGSSLYFLVRLGIVSSMFSGVVSRSQVRCAAFEAFRGSTGGGRLSQIFVLAKFLV